MTRPSVARQHAVDTGARSHQHSRPVATYARAPAINAPVDHRALTHAYALHAHNDLEGAARAFAQICRTLPAGAEAYRAFGYVLCQLGDYANAIAPLMMAVAREYGDPEPLYFAACCMQHTGDTQAAREMATDAMDMLRCSNRYPDLHLRLTRLLDTL
ncbi:hypothetical protein UC34_15195 [Pandoraea vervacti]|uniref:CesD/SycD/LcrH family type III secretion system chaperone n=1 Tax=Pandoraea vervacti TaxID=656178 RepID=A0ABN4FY07_9BURK|nr:tetratricopeptide repeat protein [Pandoraea vervacti]AJP57953.1 hypothetical protein UC34_15195 [Pandoraea vervacti]